MFVRYIDGDNVSFKELFRNIKSPIVFTSARDFLWKRTEAD